MCSLQLRIWPFESSRWIHRTRVVLRVGGATCRLRHTIISVICLNESNLAQHTSRHLLLLPQDEDFLPYPDEIDRQIAEVEAAVAVEEAAVTAEEASAPLSGQRSQSDAHDDRGMLPSSVPESPAAAGALLLGLRSPLDFDHTQSMSKCSHWQLIETIIQQGTYGGLNCSR